MPHPPLTLQLMDLAPFETMTAPELRRYLEFLLWHYRVIDAFWFLNVAEHSSQATAERLNERVWARAAEFAAKDLKARFQLEATGLRGFVEALRLYPWSILIGYRLEDRGDELVLEVPACPPQQARIKRGLGEYACKETHRAEFETFARVIDPRICVTCEFAPPDPHPAGLFCRWHFRLAPPRAT